MSYKVGILPAGKYRVLWVRGYNTKREPYGKTFSFATPITGVEFLFEARGARWIRLPQHLYLGTEWFRLRKIRERGRPCTCSRLSFPHRKTTECGD